MADMDVDELENLAQRVEAAKHQVRAALIYLTFLFLCIQ